MTSILALFTALCFADGPAVRITLSDDAGGQTAVGELIQIEQSRVVFTNESGQQAVDTAKIAYMRRQGTFEIPSPHHTVATFIDGNRLSIDQIRIKGRTSTLFVLGSEIEVPSNLIGAVRLGELSGEQLTSWQEIAGSELSSDVLVLRRAGEKLERIEGIMLGVSEAGVEFDFSGTTLTVPFERLAGMRMYSAQQSKNLPALATVTNSLSNRLAVANIQLVADKSSFTITLPCGAALNLPVESVTEIDFQSSRSMGLHLLDGNFQPASAPLGIEIASAADLTPRVTRQRLPDSTRTIDCLTFFGGGSATFRIPAGFRRLDGSLKLGSRKAGTDCRVLILIDSQTILDTTLQPTDAEFEFSVPVQDDQRLEFRVLPISPIPTGAVVFVKSPMLLK